MLITVTGFADTDGTCQKRLKDILAQRIYNPIAVMGVVDTLGHYLLLTKFTAFFKGLMRLYETQSFKLTHDRFFSLDHS